MRRLVDAGLAAVIVVLAVGLYRSQMEADRARDRIAALERDIAAARADVQTLAAETAYLGRPARIEKLARETLGMRPAGLDQIRDASALDEIAPAGPPP